MKKNIQKSGQKITKQLLKRSKNIFSSSKAHFNANIFERITNIKSVKLLVFEWILLISAVISLGVAQAFWYADSYSIKSFANGGNYTEATLGKINSLNPIFATTSSEKTVSKLLFATLSSPDYSGHIGPGLATSIQADNLGKNWLVKLRPNIFWSDGHPITNQDVIFTISILKNSKVNSSFSSNLSGVSVTEKDQNLVFTLMSPYSSFSSALNFPILPQHILKDVPPEKLLEHDFSANPVTSGPFTFRATQNITASGEKIIYMASNPNYFKGKPMLNNFAIHTFSTPNDIIKALQNGSITATAELLPADNQKINNPEIYQKQTALNSGVFAFINTKSPILQSTKTRNYLRSGIDMRSLRAPLEEEQVLDLPLLKERLPKLKTPDIPSFNPDHIKNHLEANPSLKEQTLRIASIKHSYLPALAENLNFQLKNLGFKTELNVYEPSQDFILNIIKPRSYDILIYEIELGGDSDLFAYYHSSSANGAGFNLSNYSNYLVDDLILAARSTMDPNLRAAKYSSILNHWVADVPAIGIYQTNLSYFFNKNIRCFSEDNRLIYPTDRFSDITYWASQNSRKYRTP